jgi:hypothetical protein
MIQLIERKLMQCGECLQPPSRPTHTLQIIEPPPFPRDQRLQALPSMRRSDLGHMDASHLVWSPPCQSNTRAVILTFVSLFPSASCANAETVVRNMHDSLSVLSVELVPIHHRLVSLRRQLVALAAKENPSKTELKNLMEDLRKIDA